MRSKQQQQKLAFAMALDAESEARAKEKEKEKVVRLVPPPVSSISRPKPAWFSPYLKLAAGVIVAAGLSFGIWTLVAGKSDIERGMIALNQAQGNERLIESRVSQLNYAEVRSRRGNQPAALQDPQARDYSESLFRNSINEKQDAASFHALGRLYLSERNFDKAREQFEKALAKDQNDPQLQSDMGAALLELGQIADETQREQYFNQALQHLDRALRQNPTLPEALFNRALVYQLRRLPEAKDAWRKYLEIDSTSPWAAEANSHLKNLENSPG